MKPELLSPAGDMDALKAAIHHGADAVYLSGQRFGARAFAPNFSNQELIEAFNYAHLYGVKVYVTVNTIIYEHEISEFIKYLKFLYLNGVDAVIMQDIGMINLTRKLLPNLEIHVSTQGHNCNDEVLKLYQQLGVKRVVLARELSLTEINKLTTSIDKEIFIHGALCISYSGCCLFSSLNGGRSGNRGECAGPCRLPYTLIKNNRPIKTKGPFLLSTKELNTILHFKEILQSNIQSVKIEGRMKSPEYVAYVTKLYRHLIDGKPIPQNDNDLKKLFNRGFTKGHLFNAQNSELMNSKSPNHQGIPIGQIIKIGKKIAIKLTDTLNQNDGIRFQESHDGFIINKMYNQKGLLISQGKAGDIIYLDNKFGLKKMEPVLKTTDYQLLKVLRNYPEKKININFHVKAQINKPLIITISDNTHTITEMGSLVAKAQNYPLTKDKIKIQLSKLGQTPFTLNKITIDSDPNIFINIKELNELRRKLTSKLIKARIYVDRSLKPIEIEYSKPKKQNKININVFVRNEAQLQAVLGKADNIYTDDKQLYLKYKAPNVYLRLNRTDYILSKLEHENLLVTELGGVYKYSKNNHCHTDYFLNIVNSFSVDFLHSLGIDLVTLSPELNITQLQELMCHTNKVEIIIYGYLELMVMKHCIIKNQLGCQHCQHTYHLQNKFHENFQIITKNCQTHIMHHKPINQTKNINLFKQLGITHFRLEFLNESPTEIEQLLNTIEKEITLK